jgi:chromosome segregation ATPase
MDTPTKTKIVVFVLAAGRWYSGGFQLPAATMAFWFLITRRIQSGKEKESMKYVPRSLSTAVRAKKKSAEIAADEVSKAPSLDPQKQGMGVINIRQRKRNGYDDAQSIGSVHTAKPKIIRAAKRSHGEADEVSVLSFTSNKGAFVIGKNHRKKSKKIPFSQHEEIIEFLNGKLESTNANADKIKAMYDAERNKVTELQQILETEKQKHAQSQDSMNQVNIMLENEKRKLQANEDTQGSTLHELFDKQALLEIEEQKVQRLEKSEKNLQRKAMNLEKRIEELESISESTHDKLDTNELFDIQNQRIETLISTQEELDNLLHQERKKVSKLEKERRVSRLETLDVPWEESSATKEEILVKKNREIKNLEQTVNHLHLRFDKKQKMWHSEKERAATMQKQLGRLNIEVKKQTSKFRELEKEQRDRTSAAESSKKQLIEEKSAHQNTESYLNAEKLKVANLQKISQKEKAMVSDLQQRLDGKNRLYLLEQQRATEMENLYHESKASLNGAQARIKSFEDERKVEADREDTQITLDTERKRSKELQYEIKALKDHIRTKDAEIEIVERRLEGIKATFEITNKKLVNMEEEKHELLKSQRTKAHSYLEEQNKLRNTNTMDQSRISTLERRVHQKDLDMEAKEKKTDLLSHDLSTTQRKLRTEEEKNCSLERQQTELKNEIHFAETKVNDLETELEDKKRQYMKEKKRVEELEAEKSKLRDALSSEQRKSMDIEAHKLQLSSILETEKARTEVFERLVERNDRSISKEHGEIQEINLKVSKLKESLAEKESTLKYERETLDLFETNLAATEADLTTEKNKVAGLRIEVNELTTKLKETMTFQETLYKVFRGKGVEKSQNADDRQQEILRALTDLCETKVTIAKLKASLKEKNTDFVLQRKESQTAQEVDFIFKLKQEEIDTLAQSLESEVKKLAWLESETAKERKFADEKIKKLKKKFQSQTDRTEIVFDYEKEREIKALQNSSQSEQSKILSLEQKLKATHSTESSLNINERTLFQQESAIKSLELSLLSEKRNSCMLRDQCQEFQKRIAGLTESLQKKEILIAAKTEDIDLLAMRIAESQLEYESSLLQKNSQIVDLQKTIDSTESSLETRVQDTTESTISTEQKVKVLEQSLDEKLTLLAKLQQTVNVLENELEATQSGVK